MAAFRSFGDNNIGAAVILMLLINGVAAIPPEELELPVLTMDNLTGFARTNEMLYPSSYISGLRSKTAAQSLAVSDLMNGVARVCYSSHVAGELIPPSSHLSSCGQRINMLPVRCRLRGFNRFGHAVRSSDLIHGCITIAPTNETMEMAHPSSYISGNRSQAAARSLAVSDLMNGIAGVCYRSRVAGALIPPSHLSSCGPCINMLTVHRTLGFNRFGNAIRTSELRLTLVSFSPADESIEMAHPFYISTIRSDALILFLPSSTILTDHPSFLHVCCLKLEAPGLYYSNTPPPCTDALLPPHPSSAQPASITVCGVVVEVAEMNGVAGAFIPPSHFSSCGFNRFGNAIMTSVLVKDRLTSVNLTRLAPADDSLEMARPSNTSDLRSHAITRRLPVSDLITLPSSTIHAPPSLVGPDAQLLRHQFAPRASSDGDDIHHHVPRRILLEVKFDSPVVADEPLVTDEPAVPDEPVSWWGRVFDYICFLGDTFLQGFATVLGGAAVTALGQVVPTLWDKLGLGCSWLLRQIAAMITGVILFATTCWDRIRLVFDWLQEQAIRPQPESEAESEDLLR